MLLAAFAALDSQKKEGLRSNFLADLLQVAVCVAAARVLIANKLEERSCGELLQANNTEEVRTGATVALQRKGFLTQLQRAAWRTRAMVKMTEQALAASGLCSSREMRCVVLFANLQDPNDKILR